MGKTTMDRHSLADDIHPMFLAWQLLGTIPLSQNSQGKYVVRWVHPRVLMCLFIFLATTVALVLGIKEKVQNYVQMPMADYPYTSIILVFQLMPICLILESNKIAQFLNQWKRAQDKFSQITGRRVLLISKRLVYMTVTLMMISIAVITAYVVRAEARTLCPLDSLCALLSALTLTYSLGVVTTSGFFWLLTHQATQNFALLLIDHIKVTTGFKYVQASNVRQFSSMWLSLRNLTCSVGRCLSVTGCYFMFWQFFINVAALFEVIRALTKGTAVVETIIACIPSLLLLCSVSECAHRTIEKVTTEFKELIMDFRDSPCTFHNDDVDREWRRFYKFVVTHPPTISMGGYFTLNRGINLTILGSYVTYLVIFMQMNQQK